jgi:hypothetical protein
MSSMNGTGTSTGSTTSITTTTATATTTTTTTATTQLYTASKSEWQKQLITKEDPNHLHKTLGIMVLISYIFRIVQCMVSIESDMGFNTYPQYTIPTIVLHFLLNASSFIFKIPAKRISSGYRIWPEYRLHSLVFLCRNLACMILFYVETTFYHSHEYHIMDIIIILSTMAAADISSYCQGPNHTSGFARELDVPAITKYFFSMAQLGATAMILHGQRRYTMHFIMIIIIQGNAFLMTIRRKNLASHTVLTSIYGIALLGAGIMAHYEYSRVNVNVRRAVGIIGFLATILRTGPRCIPILSSIQNNKYLLWISLYMLHENYIRPYIDVEATTARVALNLLLIIAVIALGYYKHYKEQQQLQQKQTKDKVIKSI